MTLQSRLHGVISVALLVIAADDACRASRRFAVSTAGRCNMTYWPPCVIGGDDKVHYWTNIDAFIILNSTDGVFITIVDAMDPYTSYLCGASSQGPFVPARSQFTGILHTCVEPVHREPSYLCGASSRARNHSSIS